VYSFWFYTYPRTVPHNCHLSIDRILLFLGYKTHKTEQQSEVQTVREHTTKSQTASIRFIPNVSHLVAFDITFLAKNSFPLDSLTPTCYRQS
jgi:hypothetical protein